MTGKRIIRPESYPWDPNYADQPYSLAVERHGMLCISGLTAETYDPRRDAYLVGSTSLVEQTKVIFEKMGAILQAAGYTFQDVVYTVDYALEAAMPEYRASGAVRRQAFGDSMPASVGILIEGIPDSSALMVVNAVAMRGGREKRAVFPEGTPTWERYHSRTFWPGFFVGDDWFWLSGSTGRVLDHSSGKETYPKAIGPQAQAIWGNALGQVMKDASVDPSTVVRVSDYVHPAGLGQYSDTWKVRKKSLNGAYVAATSLVVHRLLHREALLEIDATCYLGDDREAIEVPEWKGTGAGSAGAPAAVRCGKYLFCSGQGPMEHTSGKVVGQGDFQAQVTRTYENVLRVLQAAGADASDVVRTVEFTNPQNAYRQEILNQARLKAFGDQLPAVTTVTANQLLPPEAGYSMEVWAVLE